MFDLLNASIPYRTAYSLLIVLGVLLIIEILIFAILLVRSRSKSSERQLVGITLDTTIVQRQFTVGDEFDCDGLVVQANYNIDPTSENIVEYVVVSEEKLNEVKSQGEISCCYVVKPDMNEAGKNVVTVLYQDKESVYSIAITDLKQKELQPVYEPSVASVSESVSEQVTQVKTTRKILIFEELAESGMLYNKSFTARLIQSDDEVKQWYTNLKNELLSYKKIKARTSWKRETFRRGRQVVAKICFRGKTMCLYLPLNAADFAESKYHVEDVSNISSNVDTPLMYRLKSARRVKYSAELIALTMEKLGIARVERIAEDYYMPYEGTVDLINKGLVKRVIKTLEDQAIFSSR